MLLKLLVYHYLGILKNDIGNVVLSTCHHDIIDWLEPDWVLNTDTGELLHFFCPTRNQYQSLSHNK
jgi:hypothetical protein